MSRQRQMPHVGLALWLWVILVGSASIVLSRAFACATPFAALATLAAFTTQARHAVVLILFTWVANQAVGFGLLHYPTDATTIAWGVSIGLSAFAALAAARAGAALVRIPMVSAMTLSLLVAFGAYEGVLLATTLLLPSGPGAFAPSVVARILAINAAALLLLLLAWKAAGSLFPERLAIVGVRGSAHI